MSGALLRYDAACRAVAEAKSFDEVTDIRDKAEAMRVYGRQAKNRDLQVDAAEIRLRAERRLGELIAEQKAGAGLNAGAQGIGTAEGVRSLEGTAPPRLADLGIDKKLSSRAQKIAAVPQAAFEAQMAAWRERVSQENERVTTTLIREGERAERRAAQEARRQGGGRVEDLTALAATGWRAGAILADPAWKFLTRSPAGEGRSASQHYGTELLAAIKALPVGQLAAADCVLFLWMLDWCPAWALEVIAAWGFTHKTTAFTWVKENASGEGFHFGQGYWTRANPEVCWLATRGNPERLNADVRQLVVAPVMEHSRKPDEVHDRIERLVGGPYLELNARRDRDGWVTWGDELAFKPPSAPGAFATGEALTGGGQEGGGDAAPPRLVAALAGVQFKGLNERLHVAAMAERVAAGAAIGGLEARYLAAIARKYGVTPAASVPRHAMAGGTLALPGGAAP